MCTCSAMARFKKRHWFSVFACVVILAGGGIGIALHFALKEDKIQVSPRTQPLVDCDPTNPSKQKCEAKGCSWQLKAVGEGPNCTFPETGLYSYLMEGNPQDTTMGKTVTLKRTGSKSYYGQDVEEVRLDVEFHDEHRLRLKFYDPNSNRYEIPKEALNIVSPSSKPNLNKTLYDVEFVKEPHFGVKVIRRSTGKVIFNTAVAGFTFSDQYLQITTRLESGHVYGFGEHNHKRFKLPMNWQRWGIFTRDAGPGDDIFNLYGAHPFYMNLESDGNANGVFLKNSNAMDVYLQPDPTPAISYHVIGGVLDFYIFLGPTPENVVQQYTKAIGRPALPPYWSLGFQLSRWGDLNLDHIKTVVERQKMANIPQDVQYADIDYMYKKYDFTYDRKTFDGFPEFIQELHNQGQRLIVILDHGIPINPDLSNNTQSGNASANATYFPYVDGVNKDIFIKNPNGSGYLEGEVWPGKVFYPDYTHPNSTDWWTTWCTDLYSRQGIKFDGLWIDMNEPSNFKAGSTSGCDKNTYNYPKYSPNIIGAWNDGMLFEKTICMDSLQYNYGHQSNKHNFHYNLHNLYGHSMSMVTHKTLLNMFPSKRPMVLSRSTFAGTSAYAHHWLGDNQSRWKHLRWSIPGLLEFGLFGQPYVGADICGFWFDTTEELCTRWMQLGAFYPFARNHNAQNYPNTTGFKDQDPAAMGNQVILVSRKVLGIRYTLLPYLYTLFHYAHTEGSTVSRSLMQEFTADKNTWDIDTQFLWGSAFLISPALNKGQTSVTAYLPPTSRWFDYYTGAEVEQKGSVPLDSPIDHINLHMRGGFIIPWQEPANTTFYSRKQSLGLLIALDSNKEASGSLFWDDGESSDTYENGTYMMLQFTVRSFNTLKITVAHNGYSDPSNLKIDTIDIYGLEKRMDFYYEDTQLPRQQVRYNPSSKATTLTSLGLDINSNHTISWI